MITDVGTKELELEKEIIKESTKKNIKIYIAFVPNCLAKDLCNDSMPSYKKISGGRIYNLTKAEDFDTEKFFKDVIFQVENENKNNYLELAIPIILLAVPTPSPLLPTFLPRFKILAKKTAAKGSSPTKITGKCGNFEKTGGGSTRIPLLL